MGKSYVIITPAKNEERNLPLLAESLIKQTIKPAAWFIFDDGSDDRTPEIIEELSSKFSWIHGKRLEKSQASTLREQIIPMYRRLFLETVQYCLGLI